MPASRINIENERHMHNLYVGDTEPTERKAYAPPTLKAIGELKHLIMGMSGIGIDSLTRREF